MSDLFQFLNEQHSEKLQFIDEVSGEKANWQNINSRLFNLKSSYKKLAFLYLDNSLDSIITFLSFLKSDHIVTLLNSQLNITLKEQLENIYQPDYIADLIDSRNGYTNQFTQGKINVLCKEILNRNLHSDLKILLSTSGTTGSPKFVKLTGKNFIENTLSIVDYLPIIDKDSTILNLPITYSYGLSVLLTNIYKGGDIVCTNETVLSRGFWNIFKKYNCTNLAGVPYTYEMLARLGFLKMDLPQLRYLTQAGGKINEKTLKLFTENSLQKNYSFYVMYGQTEATARMSYLDPSKLSEKQGSIGKPIKNGEFRIDDKTNELIYSGPNVGCGYAENVNDLKECNPLRELNTGDTSKVDNEGYYYITGRLKRFVKLFGNRISLDEVENDIKIKYAGLFGCAGINDQTLLVFSDNKAIDEIALKNYISEKYLIHISAIKYRFIENIPLNSSHKTDYQAVISNYGS